MHVIISYDARICYVCVLCSVVMNENVRTEIIYCIHVYNFEHVAAVSCRLRACKVRVFRSTDVCAIVNRKFIFFHPIYARVYYCDRSDICAFCI